VIITIFLKDKPDWCRTALGVSTRIEGYDRPDKRRMGFKFRHFHVAVVTSDVALCLRDHGIGLRNDVPASTDRA